MVDLDPVDRKLLEALQADGRTPHARLAREVGLTPPAILERVRKLEERGFITGYRATLNPERLGLGLRVYIAVTLARHQENAIDSFLAAIRAFPEIIAHHHVTGRFDFILQGFFSDVSALEEFIAHRLTALPVIDRAETFLVLSGREGGLLPIADAQGDVNSRHRSAPAPVARTLKKNVITNA